MIGKIQKNLRVHLGANVEINDIMEAVNQDDIPCEALAQLQRNIVVMQDEMNDYRKNCADKFYSFFSTVAQAANDLDDGFAFYVDLYGHVDATIRYGYYCPTFSLKILVFRELLRSKMAALFKSE